MAKRIVAMSAKKEKEQSAVVRDDDGVAKRNVREKEGSTLGRNWDSAWKNARFRKFTIRMTAAILQR